MWLIFRLCALPAIVALVMLLSGACSSSDEEQQPRRVDDELLGKVKLDAARRSLVEIERRKRSGLPIYADCKTAKMLFLPELKRVSTQTSERMAKRLLELCQGVRPDEVVEISP
jgi:hypothetical protein